MNAAVIRNLFSRYDPYFRGSKQYVVSYPHPPPHHACPRPVGRCGDFRSSKPVGHDTKFHNSAIWLNWVMFSNNKIRSYVKFWVYIAKALLFWESSTSSWCLRCPKYLIENGAKTGKKRHVLVWSPRVLKWEGFLAGIVAQMQNYLQ